MRVPPILSGDYGQYGFLIATGYEIYMGCSRIMDVFRCSQECLETGTHHLKGGIRT